MTSTEGHAGTEGTLIQGLEVR